ncbi:B12-binding domain-containing radical SAM protein [Candidatus Woesearchaeota archaeon]|nr:B12-binding domain-containing radical SAM protein [Candidatus Woesearchaeota archaeon]
MAYQPKIGLVEVKPSSHEFENVIPGLAIPYLGAVAKKVGYDATLHIESIRSLTLEDIEKYDVLALSSHTPNVRRMYQISIEVKRRFPDKKIIMGGWHVSFNPGEALENGADHVVVGEGEKALESILEGIKNHAYLERIIYGTTADLDGLPFVDYSLVKDLKKFPFSRYPILMSRGCSYARCDFCAIQAAGHTTTRIKSEERIAEEFKRMRIDFDDGYFRRDEQGQMNVFLVDDNFGGTGQEEEEEVLRYLLSKNLTEDVQITTQARLNIADNPKLLEMCKQVGFKTFLIGIEALETPQLKERRKGISPAQIKNKVAILKSYGFNVTGLFIAGNDTDTREYIESIPRRATELGLDYYQVSLLTPFPGTPIQKKLLREGRIFNYNWNNYDFRHMTHLMPSQSDITSWELEDLVSEMNQLSQSLHRHSERLKHE